MTPLTSTDPSSIINAAQCLESCGGDQGALKTFLLTQIGNLATPPCITPTAPTLLGGVATDNNDILVIWLQPANSGSLITSYTVFWGTSSGVYTNSFVVPAVPSAPGTPRSILISGLASGTQYFFVVQSNSSAAVGCSSAKSSEGTATTGGPPPICNAGTTFANAWSARVIANGGAAPSGTTINAIANFQCGLIADGLDVLMIGWNAIVPDNFTAAITPQLLGGGNDPWANPSGLTGADLSINGIKGRPAQSTILQSGLIPSTVFAADTDGGITYYAFDNDNGNNSSAGVTAGGNNTFDLQMFAGTTYYDCYGSAAGQGRISAANAGFTGYVSGNRTAGNSIAIYEANSTTPHFVLVSGAGAANGSRPNQAGGVGFWGITNGGAFSDQRLSFCAVHHGLTQAQSALFFARIQTLRTTLGGGFV